MPRVDGSPTVEEREAEHQAKMDAKVIVTRCGVEGCGWKWEGPAGEGRELFAAHRSLQHKDQMPEPPRDPLLDVVRDIVGHGETVEIRLPEMPVKWRVDWIRRLGGKIVIDPRAPMPLQMQRDRAESNGHGEVEGRDALSAMDAGEPQQPRERTQPMAELSQCKIDGCHEEALLTRGRFAYLCETHKVEKVAAARSEGSLGSKLSPRPVAVPEPEAATPPPMANGTGDAFELLNSVVTDELIDYHQAEANRHTCKAEALRQIREHLAEIV
jgi:hypothetical protein